MLLCRSFPLKKETWIVLFLLSTEETVFADTVSENNGYIIVFDFYLELLIQRDEFYKTE